jgi:hypothetical protein
MRKAECSAVAVYRTSAVAETRSRSATEPLMRTPRSTTPAMFWTGATSNTKRACRCSQMKCEGSPLSAASQRVSMSERMDAGNTADTEDPNDAPVTTRSRRSNTTIVAAPGGAEAEVRLNQVPPAYSNAAVAANEAAIPPAVNPRAELSPRNVNATPRDISSDEAVFFATRILQRAIIAEATDGRRQGAAFAGPAV